MLTHQDCGPHFGLGRSVIHMIRNFVDTLIWEGHILSWYIMDIHKQPTEWPNVFFCTQALYGFVYGLG